MWIIWIILKNKDIEILLFCTFADLVNTDRTLIGWCLILSLLLLLFNLFRKVSILQSGSNWSFGQIYLLNFSLVKTTKKDYLTYRQYHWEPLWIPIYYSRRSTQMLSCHCIWNWIWHYTLSINTNNIQFVKKRQSTSEKSCFICTDFIKNIYLLIYPYPEGVWV